MTDLERLKYAQEYIEKLSRGINPIDGKPAKEDDLIRNIHISRCLIFVSKYLEKSLENEKKKSEHINKVEKYPFERDNTPSKKETAQVEKTETSKCKNIKIQNQRFLESKTHSHDESYYLKIMQYISEGRTLGEISKLMKVDLDEAVRALGYINRNKCLFQGKFSNLRRPQSQYISYISKSKKNPDEFESLKKQILNLWNNGKEVKSIAEQMKLEINFVADIVSDAYKKGMYNTQEEKGKVSTTKTTSNGEKEYKCADCMLYRSGDCFGGEVCPLFKPAPDISNNEKSNWPNLGDATYYRSHKYGRK